MLCEFLLLQPVMVKVGEEEGNPTDLRFEPPGPAKTKQLCPDQPGVCASYYFLSKLSAVQQAEEEGQGAVLTHQDG